jgi:hypothetical protein
VLEELMDLGPRKTAPKKAAARAARKH